MISNLPLTPVFINTARGGSRTQSTIVSNDIVVGLLVLFWSQSLSFLKRGMIETISCVNEIANAITGY